MKAGIANRVAMTGEQAVFLRDLLRDLRRLWFGAHPGKEERDLVAWMGGMMNRHIIAGKAGYWTTWEGVEETVMGLDVGRARRLIAALFEVRGRLDGGIERERVETPKGFVRAIWTIVRSEAVSEEALREAVREVTKGETESTKHLRHGEAVELLRKLGARPEVYRFVESPRGVKLRKSKGA